MINQERVQERVGGWVERLRKLGYRITPQRVAILEEVMGSREHPTAEEIYERLRDRFASMSLATVYKNLNMLRDVGAIIELRLGPQSRYDGDTAPHPHLTCVRCGRVVDLDPSLLPEIPRSLWTKHGFQPRGFHLILYGICEACSQESPQ